MLKFGKSRSSVRGSNGTHVNNKNKQIFSRQQQQQQQQQEQEQAESTEQRLQQQQYFHQNTTTTTQSNNNQIEYESDRSDPGDVNRIIDGVAKKLALNGPSPNSSHHQQYTSSNRNRRTNGKGTPNNNNTTSRQTQGQPTHQSSSHYSPHSSSHHHTSIVEEYDDDRGIHRGLTEGIQQQQQKARMARASREKGVELRYGGTGSAAGGSRGARGIMDITSSSTSAGRGGGGHAYSSSGDKSHIYSEEEDERRDRTRGGRSPDSSRGESNSDGDESANNSEDDEEDDDSRSTRSGELEESFRTDGTTVEHGAMEEDEKSGGDGAESAEDYSDDEDEGLDGYKQGGYHAVKVGDIFNQRYVVIKKLGWGHFSTVWMVQDRNNTNKNQPLTTTSPNTTSPSSSSNTAGLTFYALKVQKSAEHYTEAAMDEVELLDCISAEFKRCQSEFKAGPTAKDRDGILTTTTVDHSHHVATLHDSFFHTGPHGRHMCMVFSMLGCNLLLGD